MKRKIIGILICTLLIATVLPVTGSINAQLNEENKILTLKMSSEGISAELCFFPKSYDFGAILEGARLRATHFEIWNCGRLPSVLEWHLGIIDPEISPSPMSGQSSGEHDNVTVDVSTSGLTLGEYEFTVNIFSNAGDGEFTVRLEVVDNLPPNKPDKPSGEKDGKTGTSYPYITSTFDYDGDNVKYGWDWDGDSNVDEWTAFYSSGTTINTAHSWGNDGTYNVKVIAEDTNGAQSGWSDPLSVSMPKNKQYMPFGIILAFGFDVDVKIVQLEPGEDYVDLEVLNKPFYIWENEIETINPGAFIRLDSAKGLFSPSLPFCFGTCQDWGIIG